MRQTKKLNFKIKDKTIDPSILSKFFSIPAKIFEFGEGKTIQLIFGWFLRIMSAGIALSVIKWDYDILSSIKGQMPASSFIGYILSTIGISFTGYMGSGFLYLRASRIIKQTHLSEYPMLFLFAEIVQIFTELIGIMIVIISFFVGIISAVFKVMGSDGAYGFAPILSGLFGWASLYYFFFGLGLLIFGHAFRDYINILIKTEKNTRR